MHRFRYRLAPNWPPLAWVARLSPGGSEVVVTHGPRLETHPHWFGEIVWAGDLDLADFHQTDIVFGSGARLAPGSVPVFVSAGSTVDRLQSIEHGGQTWVSNSLACLLSQVGAKLDVTFRRYFESLGTIRRGIYDHDRLVPTSAGSARLTYFHNLVWDGHRLLEQPKPDTVSRGFATFEDYRTYLINALRRLSENAQDPRRQFPFRLLGTISGGYDSAASAILARDGAGLSDAITFARPDGSDAGLLTAQRLGISLTQFQRESWCKPDHNGAPPEAPFIASDAKGEDLFLRSAQPVLHGCLLLTGHHGGGMWNRHMTVCDTGLPRGDRSGLALTEWRLLAGFIHCPIPYLGGRHMPDLQRISQSPEMAPWTVGGGYDRPIPRRIIEEAGVPRECFARTKRAGSILLFKSNSSLSAASADDLEAWLRRHTADFLRRGKLPPAQFRGLLRLWRRTLRLLGGALASLRVRLGRGSGARLDRLACRLIDLGERDPMFDYAFPWAVHHVMQKYAGPQVEQQSRSQRRLVEESLEHSHEQIPVPVLA